MGFELYKWHEVFHDQNVYEVSMVGSNKSKIAKYMRSVQREIGICNGVSFTFQLVRTRVQQIDVKTGRLVGDVTDGRIGNSHRGVYYAKIVFAIYAPEAAAAAIAFKLKNF